MKLELEGGDERPSEGPEVHRQFSGTILFHGRFARELQPGQRFPLIVREREIAGPFDLPVLNLETADAGVGIGFDFRLIGDPLSFQIPFLATAFFFEERLSITEIAGMGMALASVGLLSRFAA